MDYREGGDIRRRMTSFNTCFRCGHYHLFGQCRALTGKCFSCFQTGHFRKVCRNNTKQFKSSKAKERDSVRMAEFIRKKTAESLPFNSTSNEELFSCLPVHSSMHDSYQKQLDNAHEWVFELLSKEEDLKQQLQELQESALRDKTDIHSKQESMRTKLEEAKNLECNLRRSRDSLRDTLHREEYKLEKTEEKLIAIEKQNADLERKSLELQTRLAALETETEQLHSEVRDSKRTIENKTSELQEITGQRDALFRYFWETDFHEFRLLSQQAQEREFCWLLDNLCYKSKEANKSNGHFECGRCGSFSFHSQTDCVAMGSSCGLCKKSNHFSNSCRNALKIKNDICRKIKSDTPPWLDNLIDELAVKFYNS